MSSVIDERIVQMRFDNAGFEKNVNSTILSLNTLKQALSFDGLTTKINNIEKNINAANFSRLTSNVDAISARFSNFGVVGMTVIQDLTRAAENLGIKLYSMTMGQIKSGGWSRATNIDQAKFQLEGLGVAWDEIKGDIDYAVDQTAYGMDAAAKVASQLVASNVAIGDPMKKALRGVSGLAAMTNSSYEDIGRIFTTVAGQGRLMGDQLNQIAGRGVNAAAKLAEYYNVTEAELRDMVSKGEVDFATFAEAMDSAFGEHAKEANKTFEGALANMKSALSRIGQPYAESIRKNAIPVFNRLREIINDIKTVIAPVAKMFDDIATKATNLFLNVLGPGKVDLSWLDNLVKGLGKAYDAFNDFMGLVDPNWNPGKEAIEETTDAAIASSERIAKTQAELDDLANKVLSGAYGSGEERRKKLEEEGYSYELVQNRVNELTGNSFRYAVAMDEVTEATEDQTDAANELANKWKNVHSLSDAIALTKEYEQQARTEERLARINNLLDKTKPISEGVRSALNILCDTMRMIRKAAAKPLGDTLYNLASIALDTLGGVGKLITQLDNYLKNSGAYDNLFNFVNSLFGGLANITGAIADAVSDFINGGGFQSILDIFTADENSGEVGETLSGFPGLIFKITKAIKDLFSVNDDGESTLGNIVDTITTIIPILGRLQPLVAGITGNLLAFKGARALSSIFDTISLAPRYLNSLANQNNSDAILKLAIAVGILAAALFVLSSMSWDRIARGGAAIGVLVTALGTLWYMFNQFSKFRGTNDITSIVGNIANGLVNSWNSTTVIKLAIAIGILAVAFYALSNISWDGIARGAVAIGAIVIALGGLWLAFNKFSEFRSKPDAKDPFGISTILGSFTKGNLLKEAGTSMLKMAALVAVFAGSMFLLSQLSWEQIKKGAVAIGVITAAIAILIITINRSRKIVTVKNPLQALSNAIIDFGRGLKSALGGVGKIGIGVLIASIAAAVMALANVILTLTQINMKDGLKAVGLLGLMLAELVIAVSIISITGGKGGEFGTAALLSGLAKTINSLGKTVKLLASISWEDGIKAVGFIGILLLELSASIFLMELAGGKGNKAGFKTALLLIAIGITVKMLGDTLKEISRIPMEQAIVSVGLIGALLLELVASVLLINLGKSGGTGISTAVLLVAIGASIKMLGDTLKKVSEIPFEDGLKATGLIGILLAELVATLVGTTRLMGGTKGLIGAGIFLQTMANTIAIIAVVVIILSKISAGGLAKGIAAIGAIGLLIVGLLALAKKSGGGSIASSVKSLTSILPLIAVLITIVGSLWVLSQIPTDKLKMSMTALFEVIISLALMMAAVSINKIGIGSTIATFVMMGLILAEITGLFYLMQDFDADKTVKLADGMAEVVLALGLVAGAMMAFGNKGVLGGGVLNTVLSTLGGLITAGGLLAEVCIALKWMLELDFEPGKLEEVATALFTALIGVGVAMVGASAISGVDLGAAAIIGLLASLMTIADYMGVDLYGENGFVTKVTRALNAIGEMINSFVSGLLGVDNVGKEIHDGAADFGESIIDGTSGIGNSLSGLVESIKEFDIGELVDAIGESVKKLPGMLIDFTTDLQTFLSQAASLTPDDINNLDTVLASIVKITATDFVASIFEGLAGDNGLETIATKLVGENGDNGIVTSIGSFVEAAKGLDETGLQALDALLQALVDITKIDGFYGILGAITGGGGLIELTNNLPSLAEAMGTYSKKLEEQNIDTAKLRQSASAAKSLVDTVKALPRSGGWIEKLIGKQEIDSFGAACLAFIDYMQQASDKLSVNNHINVDGINACVAGGKALADLGKQIPRSNGWIQRLIGEQKIDEFGKACLKFGIYIQSFSDYITSGNGISEEAVTSASNAGSILADLEAKIPAQDGMLQTFLGSQSLDDFGERLVTFGQALVDFNDTVNGKISQEAVNAAYDAGTIMNALESSLTVHGGLKTFFSGDNTIDEFGGRLTRFASSMIEFSDAIAGNGDANNNAFNNAAVSAAVTTLTGLFEFVDKIEAKDMDTGLPVSDFWDKLTSAEDAIDKLIMFYEEVGAAILSDKSFTESGVKENFEQAGSDLASSLVAGMSSYIEGEDDENAAKKVGTSIATKLKTKSVVSDIKASGSILGTRLVDGFKMIFDEKGSFNTFTDEVLIGFTDLVVDIIDILTKVSPDFTKVGQRWMALLRGSIALKTGGIVELFATMGNNIIGVLYGFTTSFTSVGNSWMGALYDAVAGWGESIKGNISSIATDIATTQEVVNTRSFERSAAVQDTILRSSALMSDTATDSVDRVGDAAANGVKAVGMLSAALDDTSSAAPSITPVMSLSNIQNGRKLLSRAMSEPIADIAASSVSRAKSMLNRVSFDKQAVNQVYIRDSESIEVLNGMRRDIKVLTDNMANMQMVLDSGVLVGQLTPGLDVSLSQRTRFKGRWA